KKSDTSTRKRRPAAIILTPRGGMGRGARSGKRRSPGSVVGGFRVLPGASVVSLPPMTALARLAALVAPLDPATFFARCYEKEPAHLRAGVAPLLTQDELFAALSVQREPPEGLVAFPEHAGVPDVAALLGDAGRLRAYLDEGHPVVWNRARGVWPAVDEV